MIIIGIITILTIYIGGMARLLKNQGKFSGAAS